VRISPDTGGRPANMTTLAATATDRNAGTHDRFLVGIASTCLAVSVVGFAPTYWIPLLSGTLDVPRIIHIHAVLFYTWLTIFVAQATLIATGRFERHRRVGLAGVAVATAMLFVGAGVAAMRIGVLDAAGQSAAGRAFSFIPLSGISLFAALVATAIAFGRRPDIHKRLMLVATVGLLNAPIGRLFRMVLAPGGGGADAPLPIAFSILPGFTGNLIIVAAMIHDRRTNGRVHPAYWIAGGLLVATQLVRPLVASSEAWIAFTRWLVPVAG